VIRFVLGVIAGAIGGAWFLYHWLGSQPTTTGGRSDVSFVWTTDSPAT
jgi:hypothetical protein